MQPTRIKYCAVCGRRMTWRKRWRRTWDQVRYCSAACRKAGLTPLDRKLEAAILDVLKGRRRAHSICPSQVAKDVADEAEAESWRTLLPGVRNAARRLYVLGKVDILQRGRPVDPSTAKGPVRIKLR